MKYVPRACAQYGKASMAKTYILDKIIGFVTTYLHQLNMLGIKCGDANRKIV
jgi:hypothetical protein